MTLVVAAYRREEASKSQYLPHLDELQRHFFTHLQPLLRAAGKPCADEVVYTLLELGQGRKKFSTHLFPSTAIGASTDVDVTAFTSAKAALLRCLAEYERLPLLHTTFEFHKLFYVLAEAERNAEKSLGYIQRAHQLRDALGADGVSEDDHGRCLRIQQDILCHLRRHTERVEVCEQLLTLSRQHFSGDHYFMKDIGVPACMDLLADAYWSVRRYDERLELQRSILHLCEDYCRRHGHASMPRVVQRLIRDARDDLTRHPADYGDPH